jgi:hypothetical protein
MQVAHELAGARAHQDDIHVKRLSAAA